MSVVVTADWVTFANLILSILGLVVLMVASSFTVWQFRRSVRSRQVDEAFSIFDAFNQRWVAFLKAETYAEEKKSTRSTALKNFHLGELLNLYDISCGGFNRQLIGLHARRLVMPHLAGVAHHFSTQEGLATTIQGFVTTGEEFAEIRKFLISESDYIAEKFGLDIDDICACFSKPNVSESAEKL